MVEDAELEAIEIESTHTIEIDSFVPRSEIDQRFFDSPYYVMPSEPVGQEALLSFAKPCAARAWWRSSGWCYRSASG
jgi:non-homologous end joining protein Ku